MKRILSIALMLAVALSLAIGMAIAVGAEEVNTRVALNLSDNITVQIKFEGVADTAVSATYSVNGREAVAADITNSGTDTIVSVPIPVKYVDKDIVVALYDSESTEITSKTTTVKQYLDALSADDEYKKLADALLAYGTAAENYFTGAEVAAPDAEITVFGESTQSKSGTLPEGLTHDSVTLILESETTIRHYFSMEQDKDISAFTFFVDYDMDGGYDNGERLIPFEHEGSWCVDIIGINPGNLDRAYTLCVKDNSSKYSFTYSALDYARNIYKKSGATNAAKALMLALNAYSNEANAIGGVVYFRDGLLDNTAQTTLIGYGSYTFGVDTYIDFVPEKSGCQFIGWTDADGNPVNMIPADTKGDVILYGKWLTNSLVSTESSFTSIVNDKVKPTADLTVTEEDGYYTYEYSSYTAPTNNILGIQHSSGNPWECMNSIELNGEAPEHKLFEFSIELGKIKDKAVLPMFMRVGGDGGKCLEDYFCVAPDGYVYLARSKTSDPNYRIAKLEDGVLTTVKFYMDWSGIPDGVADGSDTSGVKTGASQIGTVKYFAYNLDGILVSLENTHNIPSYGIGQILWGSGAPSASAGNSYGIMVGDLEIRGLANAVVCDDVGFVCSYDSMKAVRLPEGASKEGYVFGGWYSDPELKNPINSIPAGNAGRIKVYAKWLTAYASTGAGVTDNNSYFFGKALGNALVDSNETAFTVRIDTATTGNKNWVDNVPGGNYPYSGDSAIRIMFGWKPKGESDSRNGVNLVRFIDDSKMVTDNKQVFLTSKNSGDVVDVVVDLAAQTLRYYVNGIFITEEARSSIKTDPKIYNFTAVPTEEASSYAENKGGSGNQINYLIQVCNCSAANGTKSERTLAYDTIGVFIGDFYG